MSQEFFVMDEADSVLIVSLQGTSLKHPYETLAKEYEAVSERLSEESTRGLVLDLGAADWIDSGLVGLLVRMTTRIRGRGHDAVICAVPPLLAETLRGLMLIEDEQVQRFWRAFRTREQALAAFDDE